jgi:general secretion pathway protein G
LPEFLKKQPVSQGSRGLTYIELLVAMTVLAVLATVALPLARWDQKRRDEARLKITLQMVRNAIDKYKEYSDQGLIIQSDVEQKGYPMEIEELVEGVDVGDPQSPESQKVKFLQRIPVDPMTGEAEWGMRSYQDDWDSDSWGRENLYDVYSLSDRRALDGTYYRDW